MKNDDKHGDQMKAGSLEPGTKISHYEISRPLKTGGQGQIYQARDTTLNRDVALKIIDRKDVDPEHLVNEAQAAAKLNHPGIVTIFEAGHAKNRAFIAMEYVEGRTLGEYVKSEKIEFMNFLNIGIQITDAIQAAHQAQIIHRDLNPSNILIDSENRVRILDFGLASTLESKRLSAGKDFSGTLGYSSPETLADGVFDFRSDLFSLGAVLYYMFTGHEPFAGDYEAAVVYSVTNETPDPVTKFDNSIPDDLNRLIMQLLEKDPAKRPQDAAHVIDSLKALLLTETGEKPDVSVNQRSGYFWPIAFAVVLVTVILIVWYAVYRPARDFPPGKKILAVLPFENLGSPDDEYFADGMTDAVTTRLGRLDKLAVISRASSMLYKKTEKDLLQIGDELGANYILTGTIQWDKSELPGKVLIQAQLVEVSSDTYLWADSYERHIERLFSLQSDIAGEVSEALRVVIDKRDRVRLESSPTENLAAYDLYLRGNEYFNRSWDNEDIEIAIELYDKAIMQDSNFALAFAMLSRGHSSMYSEHYDRSPGRLRLAKQAALSALQLDANLAEAHLALGYYYYSLPNYDSAMKSFETVRLLEPNSRYLYNAIGAVYRRQGRMEEAVNNFKKALELDPRSYLRAFDVGLTYGLMRQNDTAKYYLDRAILLAPDWPDSYVYKAWLCILNDGDIVEANEIIDNAADRVDFGRSKYYWWLARIIKDDYEQVIAGCNPGADTAGYYIHCAQLNRLMNKFVIERAYADSALELLKARSSVWRGQARFHSYLGLAYAGLRMKDSAIVNGIKAVELLPTSQDAFDAMFLVANLAETFIIFEQYDAAVEQLRHLMSIPGFVTPAYFRTDPLWRPLHDSRDFKMMISDSTQT